MDKILEQYTKLVEKGELLAADEDWDAFVQLPANDNSAWELILESFELLNQNVPTKHGAEDVYLAKTSKGHEFFVRINCVSEHNANTCLVAKQMTSLKVDNTLSAAYKELNSKITTIAFLMFEDNEGNTNQTNKQGLGAVEVFAAVRAALTDFLARRRDVEMLIIRVSTKELKRLTLYTKMAKRYLEKFFPNQFVDRVTESNDDNILLVLAK